MVAVVAEILVELGKVVIYFVVVMVTDVMILVLKVVVVVVVAELVMVVLTMTTDVEAFEVVNDEEVEEVVGPQDNCSIVNIELAEDAEGVLQQFCPRRGLLPQVYRCLWWWLCCCSWL